MWYAFEEQVHELAVLRRLVVVIVEVCKLPPHGLGVTVRSASAMLRPGAEGGIGTSVCLHPVTCLIHTFLLGVVSVSVHLLGFIEFLSALLVVKTLPRFTCTIVGSRWRFVCWVVLCGRRSCSELSTWWASDCLELARLRLRSTMSARVLYMLGCSVRTQVMLGIVHLAGIRLHSGLAAPSTFNDVFMCVVYVRFIELSGDGPLRCIGYALCDVLRLAILSVVHAVAVEVCRLSQHVHCCCPLAVF